MTDITFPNKKKQEVQNASKEDKNQAYLSLLDVKKSCFDGMKGYSEINSQVLHLLNSMPIRDTMSGNKNKMLSIIFALLNGLRIIIFITVMYAYLWGRSV